MALKTGIEVHCEKHIRVYPVSFLFFRSMSLRSPAKKQKVAHRLLQISLYLMMMISLSNSFAANFL